MKFGSADISRRKWMAINHGNASSVLICCLGGSPDAGKTHESPQARAGAAEPFVPPPNRMGERFINPSVVTKLMSLQNNDADWLKRGKQRAAIARVLRKPMTAAEICDAARAFAPRLQLRDVWFLMRQMADQGLATPLNERSNNGRLYGLSDAGRRAVAAAFDLAVAPLSESMDWRRYSWVMRARIRKRVLLGLAQMEARSPDGQTASTIRKFIRADYPVGLNPVIRAVRELADQKLIVCVGVTQIRACRLYRLSPGGHQILEQLKR